MKDHDFSQGRMSRETGLSYSTVKKYLRRLEAPADAPDPSAGGVRRA